MKKFVFLLMISVILSVSLSAKNEIVIDEEPAVVTAVNEANAVAPAPDPDLIKTAEEVLQVITGNENAIIIMPEKLDITSLASLMQWWVWLTTLISPILLYFFNKFWPSVNKKELIIKSSSMGIIIIWAVILIAGGGFNITSVIMSLVMFVVQVFTYDKILQPLGLNSPKSVGYRK
jgi:hypothetical protein